MKTVKNDKRGRFTIQNFLIMFIVFGAIFVGCLMIVDDMNTNYSFSSDYNNITFNDTANTTSIIDNINQMKNDSQGMKTAIFGTEVDTEDSTSSLFAGAFSALRFVANTFSIFGNVINVLATSLGIPEAFVAFAIMAITILVVLGIISLIIRFRQ